MISMDLHNASKVIDICSIIYAIFTSELSLLGNEIANISGVLYILIMEFSIELEQINLGRKKCNFFLFKKKKKL